MHRSAFGSSSAARWWRRSRRARPRDVSGKSAANRVISIIVGRKPSRSKSRGAGAFFSAVYNIKRATRRSPMPVPRALFRARARPPWWSDDDLSRAHDAAPQAAPEGEQRLLDPEPDVADQDAFAVGMRPPRISTNISTRCRAAAAYLDRHASSGVVVSGIPDDCWAARDGADGRDAGSVA